MTVLGKVRIGKVKSVSNEVVNKYGTAFSTDFDGNKKLIFQYTDIRSKHLKNRVAGYITRLLVSQKKREDALKLEEAELASQEAVEAPVSEALTSESASEEVTEVAAEATPGELEGETDAAEDVEEEEMEEETKTESSPETQKAADEKPADKA